MPILRMWFERPSKDRKILAERHEAIAYLYQDCNSEITMHLRAMMKDVASIRVKHNQKDRENWLFKGVLKRMRRGNLPISDWKNFFTVFNGLIKWKIINYCFRLTLDFVYISQNWHFFGRKRSETGCYQGKVVLFGRSTQTTHGPSHRSGQQYLQRFKDFF